MSGQDEQIIQDITPAEGEKWTEDHTARLYRQAAVQGSMSLLRLATYILTVENELRYHVSLTERDAAGLDSCYRQKGDPGYTG